MVTCESPDEEDVSVPSEAEVSVLGNVDSVEKESVVGSDTVPHPAKNHMEANAIHTAKEMIRLHIEISPFYPAAAYG